MYLRHLPYLFTEASAILTAESLFVSDDDCEAEDEPSDAETISSESSWSSVTDDSDDDECYPTHEPPKSNSLAVDDTERRSRPDGTFFPQRLTVGPLTNSRKLTTSDASPARPRRIVPMVSSTSDASDRYRRASSDVSVAKSASRDAALNETFDVPESRVCGQFRRLTTSENCRTEATVGDSLSESGGRSTDGSGKSSRPSCSFVVIEPSSGGGAVVIAESYLLPGFSPGRSPTAPNKLLQNAAPMRQAEILEQFNRLRSRCARERDSPVVVRSDAPLKPACNCGNCRNNNKCKAIEVSSCVRGKPIVIAENILPAVNSRQVGKQRTVIGVQPDRIDKDRTVHTRMDLVHGDKNTGTTCFGAVDRAAVSHTASCLPSAAGDLLVLTARNPDLPEQPYCGSSTPRRTDVPPLNISFLSSINDAPSAPASPALSASGRKTRIRRNLVAPADGDDDGRLRKYDAAASRRVVANDEKPQIAHQSPRVKRMWHDLSSSSENEADLDRTLIEEVERNVRIRMHPRHSADGIICAESGRCSKALCFTRL
jgi:hypothetical protein